jgi:plasmid replication initiation protein
MLLSDIKITIGAIDPSDPGIEKAIIYGKVLNLSDTELEKQAAKPESVAFRRFNQFEERVLRKAQKEINSKTDLCFEYSPVRQGSAHKVTHVIFTIWRNTELETEEDNEQKLRLIREVESIIQEPVKTKDIERILSAAGNDTEKVRNAYSLAKNSRTPIRNLTAWLIAAIREEWKIQDDAGNYPVERGRLYDIRRGAEAELEKKNRNRKAPVKKNQFTDFEQNTYDFDALERELLGIRPT